MLPTQRVKEISRLFRFIIGGVFDIMRADLPGKGMRKMELALLNLIQQMRCAFLDRLMVFISWTGNHGTVWILLAALLLLIRKQRVHGLAAACALILDLVSCNLILKPLVGRARPFVHAPLVELLVAAPPDASFPSGHTAASFAVVFALRASGSSLWKPALAWAILMAFSRLYLYVHWPTDVLGGAALGAAVGWLGAGLAHTLEQRLRKAGR